MTREIPSPIGLQFNVKSTRAIPGGLEPALGTVLKCEIFGHVHVLLPSPVSWVLEVLPSSGEAPVSQLIST